MSTPPNEPPPRTIPPREVRESLRTNIIAGCVGMIWTAAAFGMPLPMLMESIGATGLLIGLLTTVRQVAMLAQVPGAILAGYLPSRKPFWAVVTLLHRVIWFLPALLPLIYPDTPTILPLLIVATVAASDVLAHTASAAWFSWMADLVPEKTGGRFWGLRHSWITASNLVAMVLMGLVLDGFPAPDQPGGSFIGFALVFGGAAAFGIADVIIHLRVKEPNRLPGDGPGISLERVIAPLRVRDFRQLTWAMGAWTFAVGLIGAFSVIYLRREFGVTYTQLAATTIAPALGAALAGVLIGHFIDRVGARPLLIVFMALSAATSLAWFFVSGGEVFFGLPGSEGFYVPQPVVLMCGIGLFAGAFYAGVVLCQIRLLAALCPREGRTMGMAVHWCLVGLVAALGPVLGGVVMDGLTAHPPAWELPLGASFSFFQGLVILHLLVTFAAALPLARRIQTQSGDWPVGMAARVVLGNPLQSVRNLYNLNLMASPGSSKEKANRVKSVAKSRSPMAVRDLIAELEDPATEVREETIRGLGEIGGGEAADALIARLGDETHDLHAVLARALGEIGDVRAAPALQERLKSKDRDTVADAARALGKIGATPAVPALMELFRMSIDDKITGAVAGALGLLKHFAAAEPIFEVLLVTPNPVLKRSLCIAAGDLFGEPGGFYRVLVGESREPGAEIERLIAQLRKTIRRLLAERGSEQPAILKMNLLLQQFEAGDLHGAAKALESLYSALWEGLESRNLSTGKMHTLSRFIRSVAGKESGEIRDPQEILLGVYLLVQTCPVHPLAR